MSPKVFKYLLVVIFFSFASTAVPIDQCTYENPDDPTTVIDEGFSGCIINYDIDQGDILLNEQRMKVVIFPHLSPIAIRSPNSVYFDCGTCKGCQQLLTECSNKPNFEDVQICSILHLEPSFERCIVNTDNRRQLRPTNSTVQNLIDRQRVEENEILRKKRYAKACSYPNALETAQINCRLYPKKVKCLQSCAFGYTLDKGIEQEMECNYKENVWKPTGFRECRPFVDCTLTLVSPGDANCTSMSLKDQPSCRVLCHPHEDKDPVPESEYSCDINGNWEPALPFCAKPGTGLALTKAPKKMLHDDEMENPK